MLRILTPPLEPPGIDDIDAVIASWMHGTEEGQQARDSLALQYSSDMSAAWSVAERVRAIGWTFALTNDPADLVPDEEMNRGDRDDWLCVIERSSRPLWSLRYASWAPTAPLAICRAALAAARLGRAARFVPPAVTSSTSQAEVQESAADDPELQFSTVGETLKRLAAIERIQA